MGSQNDFHVLGQRRNHPPSPTVARATPAMVIVEQDSAVSGYLTAQMAEWYRASVSLAVDSGLIPSRVKPMTLKLVFTASLLDVQH